MDTKIDCLSASNRCSQGITWPFYFALGPPDGACKMRGWLHRYFDMSVEGIENENGFVKFTFVPFAS